jgi:uncharacterized protein (TIGR04141 family)
MALEKVNLFKFKPTVTDFDSCLKGDEDQLTRLTIPEIGGFEEIEVRAAYRVSPGAEKTENDVPWLAFLNSGRTDGERFTYRAWNKFPSALAIVKIVCDGTPEFFALAFGLGGDSFMDRDKIVRDFGILAAMNICDENGLKRIQTSVHEAISTQTEKQASAGARLAVFSINEEREILRSVAGFAKLEYDYIGTLKGKESISIKLQKSDDEIDWETLVKRVHALGEASKKTDYQSVFTSYDKFHSETDKEIVEQLDALVFEQVKAGTLERVHLAPPEFLDYDRYSFQYSADDDATQYDDLDLVEMLAQKPRAFSERASIQSLKNMKISLRDTETGHLKRSKWSVYKCLVAETELHGETFILSMGDWKKISTNFLQEVNDAIAGINVVKPDYLPNDISIWDGGQEKNREDVFNKEASDGSDDLFLFDKGKIEIGGDKRYEVCDLLHRGKKFVHVKRYSSGTASISHLFSQGRFYTEAFIKEQPCRIGMKAHIDDAKSDKDKPSFKVIIPDDRQDITTNEYEVVFCVLSDKDNFEVDSLPFMSRYELMLAHSYISEMGFQCSIAVQKIRLGASNDNSEDEE